MSDINARLQRLLLRRAAERTRYENGTLKSLAASWRETETSLLYLVRQSLLFGQPRVGFGFSMSQDGLSVLVGQMAGVVGVALAGQLQILLADLKALAELELLEVPRLMQGELDKVTVSEAAGDFPVRGPQVFQSFPEAQVAELLSSPLGGARFAQSFADLSTAVVVRLRNALVNALSQGASVAGAARAVRGVLRTSGFEAERIVRSEFVRTANQASLTLFDQNQSLLSGVQWTSALNQKSCLRCSVLDGRIWKKPSEAPVPVINTHPRCRCILVPVVRGAAPSGRLTYREWFGEQDQAMQLEILGPARYKLYRGGGYRLPNFASARGVRSVRSVLQAVRAA